MSCIHLERVDAWKYCSTEQLFCYFRNFSLPGLRRSKMWCCDKALKNVAHWSRCKVKKKWDPCPALIKINRCTLRNCKASWRAADGFCKPLTKLFYEMFLYTLSENYYYLRCLFDDFDLCFGKACRQSSVGSTALHHITKNNETIIICLSIHSRKRYCLELGLKSVTLHKSSLPILGLILKEYF